MWVLFGMGFVGLAFSSVFCCLAFAFSTFFVFLSIAFAVRHITSNSDLIYPIRGGVSIFKISVPEFFHLIWTFKIHHSHAHSFL